MATRTEMLIEADQRGLLTGQKKQQFDEAVRRGLIQAPQAQIVAPAQEVEIAAAPALQPQELAAPIQEVPQEQELSSEQIQQLPPEEQRELLIKRLKDLPAGQRLALAAGGGFANIARGLKAITSGVAFRSPEERSPEQQATAAELERGRASQKEILGAFAEEQPLAIPVAQFVGEVAATAAAPFTRAATLGGRVAQTAATGAGIGAVEAAGRGDSAISGALVGAGFGAGFQGLTEAGRAIARKIKNAKAGKFAREEIKELVDVAKRENVDLFVDDALAAPFLKRLGILGEQIPVVGTVRSRIRQAGQLEDAAKIFRTAIAKDIDDFAIEAQSSLGRRLTDIKQRTNRLFTKAAVKLDPLGEIPTSNFDDAIKTQIEKELAKRRPNQALIKTLEEFKGEAGNFTFTKQLRSEVNDELSEFFKGNREAIGSKGSRAFMSLKQALDQDIESFVKDKAKGSALKDFKVANKFFRQFEVPFIDTKLSKLVKTGEPEQIISFIFATSKGGKKGLESRAKQVFQSLDDRGRQAVRGAIVDNALETATQTDKFSARIFAKELGKLDNVNKVFFKGPERERLEGLVKLFNATQRATQVAGEAAAPTGLRLLLPGVIGAGAATNLPVTIAATAALGAGIKALLQSKKGKQLLLGLNKTTPNTRAFEDKLQKINDLLTRSVILKEENKKDGT